MDALINLSASQQASAAANSPLTRAKKGALRSIWAAMSKLAQTGLGEALAKSKNAEREAILVKEAMLEDLKQALHQCLHVPIVMRRSHMSIWCVFQRTCLHVVS